MLFNDIFYRLHQYKYTFQNSYKVDCHIIGKFIFQQFVNIKKRELKIKSLILLFYCGFKQGKVSELNLSVKCIF